MQFRSFVTRPVSPIRYFLLLILFLGSALLVGIVSPAAKQYASAQNSSDYNLVHKDVVETDQGDALELNIPFFVTDKKNQPITSPRAQSAEIQIGSDPNTAQVTQLQSPKKPIYIVLLLDTSGSMYEVLDDMLNAVDNAIGESPENAEIALYKFSSATNIVRDFTEDKGLIQNAIRSIDSTDGGTCLYDAAYDVIGKLSTKDGRRAVIVFTDGRDETNPNDPSPCSRHSLQEVINRANQEETAIHSIGLDRDGNIDVDALGEMSRSTGGIPRTGNRVGLNTLFQDAVSGLGNEYLATTSVVVGEGEHPATLRVKLDDGTILETGFTFRSPKNYLPTPTPVPPTVIPVTPTPSSIGIELKITATWDHYTLSIGLGNPSLVEKLRIQVEEDGGVSLYDEPADVRGRDVFTMDIPYAPLVEESKYLILVTAYDVSNAKVRILDEEKTLNSDKAAYRYTAEKELVHVLPTPAPNEVRIKTVFPDMGKHEIVVDIFISKPGEIKTYNAYFIDEFGQKFDETGPQVFRPISQQILVPMPKRLMIAGNEEIPVQLVFEFFDEMGNQIDPDPYTFSHQPPRPPGRIERLRSALTTNVWIVGGILVVLFVILGWFIGKRNRKRGPSFAAATDYTVIQEAPDLSGQPHLSVQVIQTPSAAERKAYVVTEFPCVIGRSSSCQLVFSGDHRMSRRHAQITLRNDEFYLTDLGSNNGTSVDGNPLGANSATKLRDFQNVTFGRDTSIDIKIQYQ